MSAEEFIETYGKIELLKLMKNQDSYDGDRPGSGKKIGDGKAAVSMADAKQMLR